jgi:penicillin amidase
MRSRRSKSVASSFCLGLLATASVTASSACGGDNSYVVPGGSNHGDASVDATAGDSGAGDGGAKVGPFGTAVPVSGNVSIANLKGPVDVVRDVHGMVHIYATTETDVVRVEGYQLARDRTTQLELLRRTAEGSIAEIGGVAALDQDIAMRTIGLKRVGQEMYDALPAGAEKDWLDAYADGITQFNARLQTGEETLPAAMVGLPVSLLGPWTGADCLAIARYQSFDLSYDIEDEIQVTAYTQAAQKTFSSTATNPDDQKRAGFLVDTLRFDRPDPTTILPAFPNDPGLTGKSPVTKPRVITGSNGTTSVTRPTLSDATLQSLAGYRAGARKAREFLGQFGQVGSNDFIVGANLTANGRPLLANDPHLSLTAPAVFWMVQLHVVSDDPAQALDVEGTAFPGIPGIILGQNEHVAWGATTAYYDVSDSYSETLSADGSSVMFNGQPVALTTAKEIIPLPNGQSYEYDVQIVPQHGPILPNIDPTTHMAIKASGSAVSERWTGGSPTHDLDYVYQLLRAKNVEDARTALRSFGSGAQNWVFADDSGNIFYDSMNQVPIRDKRAFTWNPASFTGTLPIFTLPGDGTAEWTGYVPESFVPHAKNPTAGFIATANNRQVPLPVANDPSSGTLPDGTPIYLGGEYADGYRAGRITSLLQGFITAGHKITPEDLASIQADSRSPFGAALAPSLASALTKAAAEKATPGTHPDLTAIVSDARYSATTMADLSAALTSWASAGYDATSGVDPDTNKAIADDNRASYATLVFNTWLYEMLGHVFGDEVAAMGQTSMWLDPASALVHLETTTPTTLATYDATTGDSILFDDMTTSTVVESRDQRAISALLDAFDYLKTQIAGDPSGYRWGLVHTITFDSLVSAWSTLSIPDGRFPFGYPRHGDCSSVDQSCFLPGTTLATTLPLTSAFKYSEGPSQRFVCDLVSGAPAGNNALPGGEIWDDTSPHFSDEVDNFWRRNLNHPLPFTMADVVTAADTSTPAHITYNSN